MNADADRRLRSPQRNNPSTRKASKPLPLGPHGRSPPRMTSAAIAGCWIWGAAPGSFCWRCSASTAPWKRYCTTRPPWLRWRACGSWRATSSRTRSLYPGPRRIASETTGRLVRSARSALRPERLLGTAPSRGLCREHLVGSCAPSASTGPTVTSGRPSAQGSTTMARTAPPHPHQVSQDDGPPVQLSLSRLNHRVPRGKTNPA
jgi:hypothetical protein